MQTHRMKCFRMWRSFVQPGNRAEVLMRHLVCVLLLGGIGIWWFVMASDHSDAAASGTYRLVHNGMKSTLVLQADHSFRQEVSDSSGTQRAEGTWRRVGEGGVVFSRGFLTLPGEQPGEDGTAFSD